MHKPSISVIIPAYNEEKRLPPSLDEITSYMQKFSKAYEIIVVDDGSTDKTIDVAKTFQMTNKNIKILKNKRNRGKGYAIKRGVLHAKYPLTLFTDSDLPIPIEEVEHFLPALKHYDIIIASRNMKQSIKNSQSSFFRKMSGQLYAKLVNLIVNNRIRDTQCCFKLYDTKVAKRVVSLQTINHFAFDVELLLIAEQLGYSIKEIPVVWIDQKGSKVSLIKDTLPMFSDLFKIRFNLFMHRYSKH